MCSQRGASVSRDHFIHLRVDRVRGAQRLLHRRGPWRSGSSKRPCPRWVIRSTSWSWDIAVQFGDGELGQQSDAGGAKDVGEGLDPFPVAGFEEGIGLKAHLLAGERLGEPVAIARQTAQALPEVGGHVGDGPVRRSAARAATSQASRSSFLGLRSTRPSLKLATSLGLKQTSSGSKGCKSGLGAQEAVEGHPQHAGRFPADLEAGVAALRGGLGDAWPRPVEHPASCWSRGSVRATS